MPLPTLKHAARYLGGAVALSALILTGCNGNTNATRDINRDIEPLPSAQAGKPEVVELGRHLFFDNRISGDWGVSCATCHNPQKGWGDGQALGLGYASTAYFRNTPTLLNARFRNRFMWDGRLDGNDMGTLVRDMITEAHTMNMDGRLAQERLKQIPEYVAMWEKAMGAGKDPYGPAMFNVIGEFVKTIQSENVPFDRYKAGDESAMSPEAKRGYALFRGKASCINCHNGPLASDGKFHRLGVPAHPDILANPLRSITMLRHYATHGLQNYMNMRNDVGYYAISKDPNDIGKFQTPSLRDLKYTAPYMHNGVFATLDEVIAFYNQGGGAGGDLKPLGLDVNEKADLKAFLLALSGDQVVVAEPDLPDLEPRTFGKN